MEPLVGMLLANLKADSNHTGQSLCWSCWQDGYLYKVLGHQNLGRFCWWATAMHGCWRLPPLCWRKIRSPWNPPSHCTLPLWLTWSPVLSCPGNKAWLFFHWILTVLHANDQPWDSRGRALNLSLRASTGMRAFCFSCVWQQLPFTNQTAEYM